MKHVIFAIALSMVAATQALAAEGGGDRSLAVCKSINALPEKASLVNLTEDELKAKLCLSSLSVIRSADPLAGMQCRLAFKALFGEFSRRHPGKEMSEAYGRC